MTPVNYRGYSNWQQPNRDWELDPDWKLNLDRIEQTGAAQYLIQGMLKSGHPRCICLCWYGHKGHGVRALGERLEREFSKRLSGARFGCKTPSWPPLPKHGSFSTMWEEAFDIKDIVLYLERQPDVFPEMIQCVALR